MSRQDVTMHDLFLEQARDHHRRIMKRDIVDIISKYNPPFGLGELSVLGIADEIAGYIENCLSEEIEDE